MSEGDVQLTWGHVNVNVSDLEASIEFYGKLGFSVFMSAIPYLGIDRRTDADMTEAGARALGLPPGSRARGCIVQLGSGFPKLDLTELAGGNGRAPLHNGDLGLVRLCLASSRLQDDYLRLSELGVEFLSPPQPAEGGLADVATCIDPDGTLIELIEIHRERWAALGRR